MEQWDAYYDQEREKKPDLSDAEIRRLHEEQNRMLGPLVGFVRQYTQSRFSLEQELPPGIDVWELVRTDRISTSAVRLTAENRVREAEDYHAKQELETLVYHRFLEYREAVRAYVRENGIETFCRLWTGMGCLPGLEDMILLLMDGADPRTGKRMVYPDLQAALHRLHQAKHDIQWAEQGLFQHLIRTANHAKEQETAQWIHAFDDVVNAELIQRKRKILLGEKGMLRHYFLTPARELYREMKAGGTPIRG